MQIRLFERPGDRALGGDAEGDREALHAPGAAPRAVRRGRLDLVPGAGARELRRATCSPTSTSSAIRARGFRIVVDYGYSAGSFVLPLVLGPLGVEAITAHAFESDTEHGAGAARARRSTRRGGSSRAVGADLGAVFDRSAERLYLIDERGREVPARPGAAALPAPARLERRAAGRSRCPITATSQVEEVVGDRLEVVRTPASLAELTQAAAEDGVVFAGAPGGGYVFPDFLPAYDAMASLCKLLELLAPVDQPLSELVARAAAADARPPRRCSARGR